MTSDPGLSHYGLVAAKDLDGLGELLFMVVNMATAAEAWLATAASLRRWRVACSGLGTGHLTQEAGQSRPGPWGKACVYPCSLVRAVAPAHARPPCLWL